jgi:hypothetical protein
VWPANRIPPPQVTTKKNPVQSQVLSCFGILVLREALIRPWLFVSSRCVCGGSSGLADAVLVLFGGL